MALPRIRAEVIAAGRVHVLQTYLLAWTGEHWTVWLDETSGLYHARLGSRNLTPMTYALAAAKWCKESTDGNAVS